MESGAWNGMKEGNKWKGMEGMDLPEGQKTPGARVRAAAPRLSQPATSSTDIYDDDGTVRAADQPQWGAGGQRCRRQGGRHVPREAPCRDDERRQRRGLASPGHRTPSAVATPLPPAKPSASPGRGAR